MHIDMNSFFASVEQQANPTLRGKAIGVTGKSTERSIVAAASLEAKQRGVKTAMPVWKAKRLCPEIIFVPGDPSKYQAISHRFNAIFRRYTSLVQPFSIDESTLDVTDVARDYLGAVALAQSIRTDLKELCGTHITASIGIAPNKLIAKLASESKKPNGLTVVHPQDVISFLDHANLEDLCGIGRSIRRRLSDMSVETFKQLREFPREELEKQFHSFGTFLWNISRGHADDHIRIESPAPKSIGHAYTLAQDTTSPQVVRRYLLGLSDRVAFRLRQEQKAARTIHVQLRFGDFTQVAKQCRLQTPVNDGLALFRAAWKLVQTSWTDSAPVRLVGVSVSTLTQPNGQTALFSKTQKHTRVTPALDSLTKRYGRNIWHRASTMPVQLLERSSGFLPT